MPNRRTVLTAPALALPTMSATADVLHLPWTRQAVVQTWRGRPLAPWGWRLS